MANEPGMRRQPGLPGQTGGLTPNTLVGLEMTRLRVGGEVANHQKALDASAWAVASWMKNRGDEEGIVIEHKCLFQGALGVSGVSSELIIRLLRKEQEV